MILLNRSSSRYNTKTTGKILGKRSMKLRSLLPHHQSPQFYNNITFHEYQPLSDGCESQSPTSVYRFASVSSPAHRRQVIYQPASYCDSTSSSADGVDRIALLKCSTSLKPRASHNDQSNDRFLDFYSRSYGPRRSRRRQQKCNRFTFPFLCPSDPAVLQNSFAPCQHSIVQGIETDVFSNIHSTIMVQQKDELEICPQFSESVKGSPLFRSLDDILSFKSTLSHDSCFIPSSADDSLNGLICPNNSTDCHSNRSSSSPSASFLKDLSGQEEVRSDYDDGEALLQSPETAEREERLSRENSLENEEESSFNEAHCSEQHFHAAEGFVMLPEDSRRPSGTSSLRYNRHIVARNGPEDFSDDVMKAVTRTRVAPSLEKILMRFPLGTTIHNPYEEVFDLRTVRFSYLLERIVNWGSHGVVYLAKAILTFPSVSGSPEPKRTVSEKRSIANFHSLSSSPSNERLGNISDAEQRQLLLKEIRTPQHHVLTVAKEQRSTSPAPPVGSKSVISSPARPELDIPALPSRSPTLFNFSRFFRFLRKQSLTNVSVPIPSPAVVLPKWFKTTVITSDKSDRPDHHLSGWKSQILNTGMNVAVKIIDVEQVEFNVGRDELDHVFLEAALLSQFDHPSVTEHIESFSLFKEKASFLVIVQEFLVGSVCRLYADFGPLPEFIIAFLLYDILSALASLHEGVGGNDSVCIHHDIKASNILLSSQCVAKLVDFGVSTIIKKGQKSRAYLGTPQWMAPEAITSDQGVDTSADIWSLGITAIEMATAGLPIEFRDKSTEEIVRMIAFDPEFIPKLKDGVFPAGRLSIKPSFRGKGGVADLDIDLGDNTKTAGRTPSAPDSVLSTTGSTLNHESSSTISTQASQTLHGNGETASQTSNTTFDDIPKIQSPKVYSGSCSGATPKMVEMTFSSELKNFVATCLQRDPSKRPTARNLLQHPFLNCQVRPPSYKELFITLLKTAHGRPKVSISLPPLSPSCASNGSTLVVPESVKEPMPIYKMLQGATTSTQSLNSHTDNNENTDPLASTSETSSCHTSPVAVRYSEWTRPLMLGSVSVSGTSSIGESGDSERKNSMFRRWTFWRRSQLEETPQANPSPSSPSNISDRCLQRGVELSLPSLQRRASISSSDAPTLNTSPVGSEGLQTEQQEVTHQLNDNTTIHQPLTSSSNPASNCDRFSSCDNFSATHKTSFSRIRKDSLTKWNKLESRVRKDHKNKTDNHR